MIFDAEDVLSKELIFGRTREKAIKRPLQERLRFRKNLTLHQSKLLERCVKLVYLPESSISVVSGKCAMVGVYFPYKPNNF